MVVGDKDGVSRVHDVNHLL